MPENGRTGGNQETEITLGLLNAVHDNEKVTQRSVAKELGIALGLANAYLKRCVRKGLIKVKQVPPNRYAYYLTPQGFAEKSRLTAEYLRSSFTFFRGARNECAALLAACQQAGWRRVALVGGGELAEIAALCGAEYDIELTVILEGEAGRERFAGLPAAGSLDSAGPVDAVIITDMEAPQAVYDALSRVLPGDRILTPALLGVSRAGAGRLAESEGDTE